MNTQKKLLEIIGDFDTAMLVTHATDGTIDARPMAVAQVTEEGDLWFVTDRHSGKVAELTLDSDVAVTMQSSNKFVALSGKAVAVDDQQKLEELWQESWKVWFPKGKASPSIILLRIETSEGEYWDNSGAAGAKYLIQAGKAYLQGERAQTDSTTNASVSL